MGSTSVNDEHRRKNGLPLFVVLIVAGLAGNYFNFPIFLNIDFLFGSIFALLALQYFGLGRGVLAATLIASYTYFLWHERYAFVIMTAEVAVVGWLMAQRKIGMVAADALYWLVLGMPLGYFFYQVTLDVAPASTYIIITKQAVNGIANALLARLIFTSLELRSGSAQMSFRENIYNLLAFFVLCPALIMLAVSSRADFSETDRTARDSLMQDSGRVHVYLETWLGNRRTALLHLAKMAAPLPPQQMQTVVEQAQKSDVNFLRVGLVDQDASTVACSPLMDELGSSTLGLSFADSPFVPILKQSRKPMLSEVVMGKFGIVKPHVVMLVPVVSVGDYKGYVLGVLDLNQIRSHLDRSASRRASLYSLVDKYDNIILTNHGGQTVMQALVRGKGTFTRLDAGVSQWVPVLPPDTSISERWRDSFYVAETTVGESGEWKVILEQPMAPYQTLLYNNYSAKLTLLFLILLVALALAEYLSRRIIGTLEALSTVTRDLALKLATDGKEIAWPKSGIQETQYLINNFRELSSSLSVQFNEVRQINESLEQRVAQRTAQLQTSEQRFRSLIEWSPEAFAVHRDGNLIYANPAAIKMFGGASLQDIVGKPVLDFVHPDFHQLALTRLQQHGDWGLDMPMVEEKFLKLDGSVMDVEVRGIHINYDGKPAYQVAMRDVTERKQMEDRVRQFAFYDPLTKLPNRRLLEDRLSQAMAASKRSACFCALMFLDLDNFKPLNDSHGHAVGDVLLIEVSDRLKSCVRDMDTVARIGGDEFVVMLNELDTIEATSTAQAQTVAEKIRTAVSALYELTVRHDGVADTQVEHRCSASIGVVLFIGNGASQDHILRCADTAMYQAKEAGRNMVRFYAAPT